MGFHKVELDTDKWSWHPSPLVGQIVLVTTVDGEGAENVSTKSWVSMAAFNPPVLSFGCNLQHRTAKNVLATGDFVVNVPGSDLVEKAWEIADLPPPRSLDRVGLTGLPAIKVRPRRIAECRAHFECSLDSWKAWGEEVTLFGRMVSFSMDEEMLEGDSLDRYERLGLSVYLEDRTYGVVKAHKI